MRSFFYLGILGKIISAQRAPIYMCLFIEDAIFIFGNFMFQDFCYGECPCIKENCGALWGHSQITLYDQVGWVVDKI